MLLVNGKKKIIIIILEVCIGFYYSVILLFSDGPRWANIGTYLVFLVVITDFS